MAKDFLLEIGTEEIPAGFMPGILQQMETRFAEMLKEYRLQAQSVDVLGTPRRLTIYVHELAERQEDVKTVNKGPSLAIAFTAEGEPTKAAIGFAKGQGIDPAELVKKDGYVYAEVTQRGQEVEAVLPELLAKLIEGLHFPKSMRWGEETLRFVRPIRWLVSLYGEEIIPFALAGVAADRYTRGHRFLGREDVPIAQASDYFRVMQEQSVVVAPQERKEMIVAGLKKAAQEAGGEVVLDEDLLEEVIYLVEYPTVLCGGFEERYLNLPDAAVITPMKDHQRYFPIRDQEGHLLPKFLTVRNGGTQSLALVQVGNERVLRARLADAEFFFNEDRKISLADRYARLERIVFQEGLGSMQDKTERLQAVAKVLAQQWRVAAEEDLTRAVHLAKTDLTTAMVTEFTELQGEIGQDYARLDGEKEEVARAIREQYLPRFAGDALPETDLGMVLSVADKIDNIMATFSRGHVPSGSQDPFALRRQAIGIVQISLQNRKNWSLRTVLRAAAHALKVEDGDLVEKVAEFILQRLRIILTEQGIRHDVLEAVLVSEKDNLYAVYQKALALQDTGAAGDEELYHALTRVLNLKKHAVSSAVQEQRFQEAAEKDLYAAFCEVSQACESAYENKDYVAVYDQLRKLVAPINHFFDHVIVMAEDPQLKENRLALLNGISTLVMKWADWRKLTL